MKTILASLLLLASATAAVAVEKSELDNRIHQLTARFEALQRQPDKAIPAETLRRAQGIVLLDRTKAGFLFAYQGGGGVAMVKGGNGRWSPAAFLGASEASLGFQIGGEQNFYVILLMNTNATRLLTDPNFEFGGEAHGTAGDASSGVEGKYSTAEQSVLVFDDRKGLFGGVSIKAGAVQPDEESNRVYYDQYLSMRDILFDNKVPATEAARDLATKIADQSRDAKP